MTPAPALFTLTALGFAADAVRRGDWRALAIAAACGSIYAAVFVADWAIQRRARSAERFRAKFLRPADVRVERARRRAS